MIAEQHRCLDSATLADLLAGRMPSDRFSSAIEHIESCERCMRAAEENSNHANIPWLRDVSSSSADPKFENEPECSLVVGNLLIQPVSTSRDNSASQAQHHQPPKETLGLYRLISSLGSGGMGTVYLAEHQRLKRQVAIKLLPRDKLARSGWLDRFNREMTAIAALEHPHVVRALDAGDEDQWHYLVMEYLDGLDLNRVARRIPDIPIGAACDIIRQAALGLSAIHEAGMIHRDIKPSNVFLTRSGTVKLLDLGLVLDGESPLLGDERLTTVGHLMGTLPFMAREQLDDATKVDWRADIYSLGATLYRLLCGKAPYGSAENLASTIHAINTTEAPSIGLRRKNLPAELIAIVDRMLSSNLLARPQSAIEIAELLKPFCEESSPKELIRSAMQCTSEDELSMEPSLPMLAPASSLPPRARWPWWIAAAFLPFAFAAGIFVTITTDNGTLVIESNEPNASVKILQGDKVVEQLEVTQSMPAMVTLRSGKYVIELTGLDSDKLEVKNNQVLLSRGDRQIASVIRKESNPLAGLKEPSFESFAPTLAALAVPTKTYQGKSLAEWTAMLSRERSGEVLASAMEAVHILADTPEEKFDAMRLFLQASRQHGYSPGGGGRRGVGGGGGKPEAPGARAFSNALVAYFPKMIAASPEQSLLAIADEFEKGTDLSKTACIALLSRCLPDNFVLIESGNEKIGNSKLSFRDIGQSAEGRLLLTRLDSLVSAAIRSNADQPFLQSNAIENAHRFRVALGYAMERDLSQDPQIMSWAKQVLEETRKSASRSESILPIAITPAFDVNSAIMNFSLLKGTQLDFSPLLEGLLQTPIYENQLPISSSMVAEICERNPEESFAECERWLNFGDQAHVKLLTSKSGGSLLQLFAQRHPNPIAGINLLLDRMQGSVIDIVEHHSTFQQLLVRMVVEMDLQQDPDVDAKLAYAACAFSNFEIPSDASGKVMSVFFARLRTLKSRGYAVAAVNTNHSLDSWSAKFRRYNSLTRQSIWNAEHLGKFFESCCTMNPSAALEAFADALRTVGAESTSHWDSFLPSKFKHHLIALTPKERRICDVDSKENSETIFSYLQSDAGRKKIAEVAVAMDANLARTLQKPFPMVKLEPSDARSAPYFNLLITLFERLVVARFLDEDIKNSEPTVQALRQLAKLDARFNSGLVEGAIAEVVGYENYPIERLLTVEHHRQDFLAAKLAVRVWETDPIKFQAFFRERLERVQTAQEAFELLGREPIAADGQWYSIIQQLLVDPTSREPILEALMKIVILMRMSDEPYANGAADALIPLAGGR